MNTLIASPQKYSFLLSKKLQADFSWEPVFFLTKRENENEISDHFPQAVLHNYIDSVKGVFPVNAKLNLEFYPELIEKLENSILTACSMLDRNDSNSSSFSFSERLLFCHNLISKWASILNQSDIQVIVFEEEPHQASDYLLYKVAKALGIKTILFVRTISNLGIIPTYDFEKVGVKFKNTLNQNLSSSLKWESTDLSNKNLEAYLSKLRGNYDQVLKEHLWDQTDSVKNYSKKKKHYYTLIKYFLSKNVFNVFFQTKENFESDQKEKNKSFSESRMAYSRFVLYKIKTIFTKWNLYKYYIKISLRPDLKNEKYVLCALQYQPEKSTCPLGGMFNDQILMIKYLRKYLPKEVKIFVKEHPSQFVYNYSRYGEYFRNKNYYKRIVEIENTFLLDLSCNIFDCIDNSDFVASVTGTICWEAVNRSKKAICFGDSWMNGCEGIQTVKNNNDLKRAIEYVSNEKNSVNINKISLFASTISSLEFNAAVGGPSQLIHKNVSEEENAEILFNAIKWLES